MAVVVYRPRCVVRVNGQVVRTVEAADSRHSLAQQVSAATVTITGPRPAFVVKGAAVTIEMGNTPTSFRPVFAGLVTDLERGWWPRSTIVRCEGVLSRARRGNPSGADTDLSLGGAGQTDVEMIISILTAMGITSYDLSGVGPDEGGGGPAATQGRILGNIAQKEFIWRASESALGFLNRLDAMALGFRLYDYLGQVKRRRVGTIPRATPVWTYTEGVDIERLSNTESLLDLFNRVVVVGATPAGAAGPVRAVRSQANAAVDTLSGYATLPLIPNPMIEKAEWDGSGVGIAAGEVAAWQLAEHNLQRLVQSFTTPLDRPHWPGMTVRVTAPQGSEYNRDFVVQGCQIAWQGGEAPRISQTLDLMTALDVPTSPVVAPPEVLFTLAVEQEGAVIGGVETTVTVVQATDASVALAGGGIASDAWSAPGGTPASGSGPLFTTRYTTPAGAEITRTVTTVNGGTDSLTKPVPPATDPAVIKHAFSEAQQSSAGRFDGTIWRVDVENAARSVTVTSNGPVWAAGPTVMVSTDQLGTSAAESQPFGAGTNVTDLWIENDVSSTSIMAGASDGRYAVSSDGGATWTVFAAGPWGAAPVVRVAVLRDDPTTWIVLTAGGYYVSRHTSGTTWALELGAEAGETFEDMSLSHTRNMIAMTGGRRLVESSGVVQVLPLTPAGIIAVTADIRQDRFYAYDNVGRTYFIPTSGGVNWTQGADLPSPAQAQARGLWRSGLIAGLLVFANGTNGAWKSLDGFASAGGYLQIRQPGVGNAPAAGVWRRIGLDGAAAVPNPAPPPVVTGTWYAFARHGIAVRDSGTGVWAQLNPGTIYDAQHMASPPGSPSVLYVVAKYNPAGNAQNETAYQLLRSANGGASWTVKAMPAGGVEFLACRRGAVDEVWAMTPGGIRKSLDQGATWSLFYAFTAGSRGYIDVWDDGSVQALINDAIRKISAAGALVASWDQSFYPHPDIGRIDPAYTTAWWGGLYTLGGSSSAALFKVSNAPNAQQNGTLNSLIESTGAGAERHHNVVRMRHDSAGNGIVIVSAGRNGGTYQRIYRGSGSIEAPTWATVLPDSSAKQPGSTGKYRLAHDYLGKLGWLMTGTETSVFVSTNDGVTWTEVDLASVLSNPLSSQPFMHGVVIAQ